MPINDYHQIKKPSSCISDPVVLYSNLLAVKQHFIVASSQVKLML